MELTTKEEAVLKKFVLDKKLASNRVSFNIGTYKKKELAEMIGISRPTLNVRLKNNSWTIKELELITKKLPY